MRFNKRSKVLATAVALLALGACGGDNDNDPGDNIPPPGPTPPTAGDTIAVMGNNLVTFNRATPGTIATTRQIMVPMGETIVGGDYRPSNMTYYVVTNASAVYAVNVNSGAVSGRIVLSTPIDPAATRVGVDFNPVPDRLRIVTNTGQNLRVNVDAAMANTTVDGSLTLASAPQGADEVAYNSNFGRTCRTQLFYIDTESDQLLTTTQPNAGVLTAVGSLGVDATGASGFEFISSIDPMTGNTVNNAIAALTVGGSPVLYSINMSTGAATALGNIGSTAGAIVGLSVLPSTTMGPPGDVVAVDSSNNVVSFLAATPTSLCTSVPVNLPMGENLLDLDVRPANGMLYGLSSASKVYVIDPRTGAATMSQTLSTPLDATANATFGIDFNPVPDRLRIVSSAGQNLRVNVDTGATIVDGNINGVANASVTAVAYTNSIAGTVTTRLFDIDTGNDQLALQNPPNNGTLVPQGMGLGLATDVVSASGFDINGLTNQAFAALNLAGAAGSALYTVDVNAGTATVVGNIAGSPLRGMALLSTTTQASKATVVAVTDTGMVVNFNPASPNTTSAPVMVTGLQGGEMIIGIDQRPTDLAMPMSARNRQLVAATTAGRLYTLNLTFGPSPGVGQVGPITAAAVTNPVTLVADPTDMAGDPPFTALAGASFGTDFNPVPDRLRITSDANQNLRINVDTGATITDGALSGLMALTVTAVAPTPTPLVAPSVVASAYTFNIQGGNPNANAMAMPPVPATTLYDIDVANSLLLIQNPPNNGTLVAVGAGLGVGPFTANASFDIVGGDNTLALATLQLAPPMANGSGLYLINLAAGTAARQPADAMMAPANVIGGATPLTITAATIVLQ